MYGFLMPLLGSVENRPVGRQDDVLLVVRLTRFGSTL